MQRTVTRTSGSRRFHSRTSAGRGLLAVLVRLGGTRLSTPRPFSAFALAAAVTAASVSTVAEAQLVQRMPSPISAAEFEAMMRIAGIDDAMREVALGLHEEYFKRFREFERNEIEPVMKSVAREPDDRERFFRGASVEEARREAEMRRRLFRSAAQIDGQLVDELTGVLTAEQALRAESIRSAMTRRRAMAAIPRLGLTRTAPEFDLRTTSAFSALPAEARTRVQPSLEAYDLSLTQLLERMAESALARSVRIAEIRAAQAADAGEAADAPGVDLWMRMREAARTADADLREIDARIRRLHRDTLGEIEIALSPQAAYALRADLVRGLYPRIQSDGPFDAVRRRAESLRAAGKLGESEAAAVDAAIAAHDLAARPMIDGMMGLVDDLVSEGLDEDFQMPGEPENPERARIQGVLTRMGADLMELSRRDADALSAAAGLDRVAAGDGREMPATPFEIGAAAPLDGAAEGGTVEMRIMVGGPDGEIMELSGDDLGDDMGGLVFTGFGGMGGGASVAPRMDAKELDALAARLGLDGASRALFDELVARAMEARNEAERVFADRTAPPPQEGGGATMTFVIGGPDPASFEARRELSVAIDASEERLFDDLRAVVAADKLLAAESSRRARARTRLLHGEKGAHAADFAAIVDGAALSDASRALLAGELRAWDESSVAALEAMRAAVVESERIQAEVMKAATVEQEVTRPDGTKEMAQSVEFSAETSMRMGEATKRAAEARASVADGNRRTRDAMLSLLAADESAAKALRRAVSRAMTPAVYTIPRDLEPFFARASAVEALPPSTRPAIESLRAEWIESREVLCEEFVAANEAPAAADAPGGLDIRSLGARTAARRKLRADLEQLEASVHRRLVETLLNEAGPVAADAVGALPSRGPRRMP